MIKLDDARGETILDVYGTQKAIDEVKKRMGTSRKISSIFMGSYTLNYHDFAKVQDVKEITRCYLIGGEEKLPDFKKFSESHKEYGASYPSFYGRSTEFNDVNSNIIVIWGLILALMLIVTLYERIFQRKENTIKIILGENVSEIFLKNILIDTVTLGGAFLVLPLALSHISNVYYQYHNVTILFIVFLLVNILVHCMIFRVNFKKDFSTGAKNNALTTANYIFKYISLVLITFLISSNLFVFKDIYSMIKQKDFYKDNDAYSIYYPQYEIDHSITRNSEEDYKQIQYSRDLLGVFSDEFSEYDLINFKDFAPEYESILLNYNAASYFAKSSKELAKLMAEVAPNEKALLIPKSMSRDIEQIKEKIQFFPSEELKILYYNHALNITSFNWSSFAFHSYYDRYPIVTYFNDSEADAITVEGIGVYAIRSILYNIPQEKLDDLDEIMGTDRIILDEFSALEKIMEEYNNAKRNAIILSVTIAFLLLLEWSLISFIIKLEYQYNAIEISLKRIFGYSLIARNKKIVIATVISSLCGIVTTLLVGKFLFGYTDYGIMILVGVILLMLELITILIKAFLLEKRKIAQILKGERV
jgi:hypothetical protein